MKRLYLFLTILSILVIIGIVASKYININPLRTVGEPLDSFHGVTVYYNGAITHVEKRNVTADGYNLGLQYQCVEFVKRYYYKHLQHQMPNSFGHAKDFFDPNIKDGKRNTQRNLVQYTNESISKPKVNDIVIFKSSWYNSFGHVAIIFEVTENTVTIIQQNAGIFGNTRVSYNLTHTNGHWKIEAPKIVGWLRKE